MIITKATVSFSVYVPCVEDKSNTVTTETCRPISGQSFAKSFSHGCVYAVRAAELLLHPLMLD